MEKMKIRQKNPKVKTFLFFLGLAVVFWFLTKFSKETKTTLVAAIAYTNVPSNTVISQRNSKDITFDITANGFQLLYYAIKEATIHVDVSKYLATDSTKVIIQHAELTNLIKKELGASTVENLSKETLSVFLDKTTKKKVPVVFEGGLTYKEGFRALNGAEIVPDSVEVEGPSETISNIHSISTKSFSKKKLDEDFSTSIHLIAPDPAIKLYPSSVELKVRIAEFTQKQISVPIETINLPDDMEIKILPETISLTFEVSVHEFNKILAHDFRVVCDFSEKITEGNFMIPKVVSQPKSIFNITFEPKKVEYLIFK
ncbi:MAG TPA: CdaR family protein [Flavobacteriaceae bacterium]|nr:YbbR-like domain-containing protein [Flavobacteriaceae bacterium]MCB9213701.1 YbbR-like domain-containing protein [Alteromonas sp.]HPF11927.1 CdaR family protein [Flavobacteriaceae bacterium]HQU21921.1 CdaR family protein [Flavobacteriaceae bacterium]HRW45017.1 CdaR family protein [Flavobacteriaceae bacterium]